MANLLRSTGPWMAAAVVLVAAFMYWLYSASSNIDTGVAAADTATTEGPPTVADTAFAANPQRFANRRILLRPLLVQERLGRAALTVNLPGREAYPFVLDRVLLDQGMMVVEGDNMAAAGQVFALNDSILDVWAQRGVYDSANREKLAGSSTFFLVDSLELLFPEQQQSSGGQ